MRFVLLVESLHMTASYHLGRVLVDVLHLHLFKQLLLLAAPELGIGVHFIQLIGELHLFSQIAWIPIAGQAMENSAVTCEHEHLNVVWTGTVTGCRRLTLPLMPAGSSNISLIGDIRESADEVVFQIRESWIL